MRIFPFLAAVAAALLPAYAEHNPAAPPDSVAVLMIFDGPPSPVSLHAMQTEVETIMNSCHLQVDWRLLDASSARENFDDLMVARFHGRCRASLEAPRIDPGKTLGRTPESNGEILSFPEVDCDALNSAVQPSLRHQPRYRLDLLFGRAMGRVLAHEMYHILFRTRRHTRTGITKARLSASDLTREESQLECPRPEPPPPTLHAAAGGTTGIAAQAR
jgi:hypothetical protein